MIVVSFSKLKPKPQNLAAPNAGCADYLAQSA